MAVFATVYRYGPTGHHFHWRWRVVGSCCGTGRSCGGNGAGAATASGGNGAGVGLEWNQRAGETAGLGRNSVVAKRLAVGGNWGWGNWGYSWPYSFWG